MNTFRLIVTMSMITFLRLVNIAPNEGSENSDGDKIALGGAPNKRFEKQAMFALVESMLPLYHLYYYGSQALTWSENLFYLFAFGLFLLRIWCYQKLGKFFTYTIMVKSDHQLIQDGPYKYLVHPSYTGQVGVMLTFIIYMAGLEFGVIWFFCLPMIGTILTILLRRMDIEEHHLIQEMGQPYLNYLQQRKRLIPFLY